MFEPKRLKGIGGQNNQEFGGDVYTYAPSVESGDTTATMLANDFFLPAFDKLNIDDIIIIVELSKITNVRVSLSIVTSVTVKSSTSPTVQDRDKRISGTKRAVRAALGHRRS